MSDIDSCNKSSHLYSLAAQHLAGGVSSNFRLAAESDALFFERASRAYLYSVDGNTYIDYVLGMGPVILGHCPPAVIHRVADCLQVGQLYGGQHKAEVELAERLVSVIPCAEKVRFSSSGSEAVQASLRLARAYTGRPKIVKFEGHYHGWFDNIFVGVRPVNREPGIGQAPESEGQDPLAFAEVIVLPWNDAAVLETTLRMYGQEIAAVITEPIMCNTGVILPRPGYLEAMRRLCSALGIVLIFDEVITGFRVALGGAQALLGVTPDLAVFAKAMAAGFPISCLAGKSVLMDFIGSGRVMHGGTYNSNGVSTAAALATIEELQRDDGAAYRHLYALGEKLMDGLRSVAQECGIPLLIQGLGPVFHTAFTGASGITDYWSYGGADAERLGRFIGALLQNGVRLTSRGTWFLSTAHTEADIDRTVAAADKVLRAELKFLDVGAGQSR